MASPGFGASNEAGETLVDLGRDQSEHLRPDDRRRRRGPRPAGEAEFGRPDLGHGLPRPRPSPTQTSAMACSKAYRCLQLSPLTVWWMRPSWTRFESRGIPVEFSIQKSRDSASPDPRISGLKNTPRRHRSLYRRSKKSLYIRPNWLQKVIIYNNYKLTTITCCVAKNYLQHTSATYIYVFAVCRLIEASRIVSYRSSKKSLYSRLT